MIWTNKSERYIQHIYRFKFIIHRWRLNLQKPTTNKNFPDPISKKDLHCYKTTTSSRLLQFSGVVVYPIIVFSVNHWKWGRSVIWISIDTIVWCYLITKPLGITSDMFFSWKKDSSSVIFLFVRVILMSWVLKGIGKLFFEYGIFLNNVENGISGRGKSLQILTQSWWQED